MAGHSDYRRRKRTGEKMGLVSVKSSFKFLGQKQHFPSHSRKTPLDRSDIAFEPSLDGEDGRDIPPGRLQCQACLLRGNRSSSVGVTLTAIPRRVSPLRPCAPASSGVASHSRFTEAAAGSHLIGPVNVEPWGFSEISEKATAKRWPAGVLPGGRCNAYLPRAQIWHGFIHTDGYLGVIIDHFEKNVGDQYGGVDSRDGNMHRNTHIYTQLSDILINMTPVLKDQRHKP